MIAYFRIFNRANRVFMDQVGQIPTTDFVPQPVVFKNKVLTRIKKRGGERFLDTPGKQTYNDASKCHI